MWREPLPDEVILSDFERLLGSGTKAQIADQFIKQIDVAFDLLCLMDAYGWRLGELGWLGVHLPGYTDPEQPELHAGNTCMLEVSPDEVILRDFNRLLELGDLGQIVDRDGNDVDVAPQFLCFLDVNGSRFVDLVREGLDNRDRSVVPAD